MVFTSFNFVLFFPAVILIYYITPIKFRWITLLITGYFFYANIKPVYVLLLMGITLSTYVFTGLIDKTNIDTKKKRYMIINIILILLPLFFYKYFPGINNLFFKLLGVIHIRVQFPENKLILPIGISYYTFMAIGYTVDVYNEEIKTEKNLGILALFISFFPLLLSGPIERAKNILPQFNSIKYFDYSKFTQGCKIMLWGYFMKLVIADRIAIYVDAIYGNIPEHNGTSLIVATLLYPFQVYADLGGYSLIAIGTANILGFKVIQNFNRPFCATSMSEFWRRFHISLISWLTDYIFTPLNFLFRKYKVWGTVSALMITFLLSGIWHEAAWTFIIWGLLQGTFLSIEALSNKKRITLETKYNLNNRMWYSLVGITLTFILFTASELFDRMISLSEISTICNKIFTTSGPVYIERPSTIIFSLFGILVLLFKDFMEEFSPSRFLLFENKNRIVRLISYCIIIIIIFLIGVFDGGQFIYFQY
jgi:alginate O-acetyltransferase complex protein AlgI